MWKLWSIHNQRSPLYINLYIDFDICVYIPRIESVLFLCSYPFFTRKNRTDEVTLHSGVFLRTNPFVNQRFHWSVLFNSSMLLSNCLSWNQYTNRWLNADFICIIVVVSTKASQEVKLFRCVSSSRDCKLEWGWRKTSWRLELFCICWNFSACRYHRKILPARRGRLYWEQKSGKSPGPAWLLWHAFVKETWNLYGEYMAIYNQF